LYITLTGFILASVTLIITWNTLKGLASFMALQLAIQEFWDDIKKQIGRMDEVIR
jgi:hypothetical protein